MDIKEIKNTLMDNDLIVKPTTNKGEYLIVNKELGFYQTVRFTNETPISPAYVKVLHFYDDGDYAWANYTLDGFLKLIV